MTKDLRSAASGIFAFFLNLHFQGKVGYGKLWSIGSKTSGSCTEAVFSVECRWWRQGTICCTILLLYENMRSPFSDLLCGLDRANTWCAIASQRCFDNHGDKLGQVHYKIREVESLYPREPASLVVAIRSVLSKQQKVQHVLFLSCSVLFLWFGLCVF